MPIPKVFGTEHEYVIHVADPKLPQGERWHEERMMAIALLQDFREKFFPGLKVGGALFDDPQEMSAGLALRMQREREDGEDDDSRAVAPDFLYGFMTPLGQRFYLDHGYFEGCTPECDDPFVLLACEIAQDELIADAFERRFRDHPLKPRLYKNVSDGRGNSQAAHRNFCVAASLWPRLVSIETDGIFRRSTHFLTYEARLLLTWHVIEQIFGGAGKYGDEAFFEFPWYSDAKTDEPQALFQISGRADFMGRCVGGETTHDRPLINQRYEPLADQEKYGRYHCISGDATRAEWSYLFKMGLTAIILGMIEDGALPLDFYVKDPVSAIKDASRDPTCRKPIEVVSFSGGKTFGLSPLEMTSVFLKEMRRYISSRNTPPWAERILEKAEWALWALHEEPQLLERVLDWKIKERIGKGSPHAFSRHINYHAVWAPTMLYRILCGEGAIETVTPRDVIEKYKAGPPETTRAYFRGKFIGYFYKEVNHYHTDWERIVLEPLMWDASRRGYLRKIDMPEPLGLTQKEWGAIFESTEPPLLSHFVNIFGEYRTLRR